VKAENEPEGAEAAPDAGVLVPWDPQAEARERVVALVLDTLGSEESKRAYRRALEGFLAWLPPRAFTRAAVHEYRSYLEGRALSPSTINLQLAAIRKLALEATDNQLLDPARAAAIGRVKGVPRRGVRLGRWATAEEAALVLRAPDPLELRGLRDRAILSVLIGCGLRRQELAVLDVADLQERDGRAVFADLEGKGRRVRTVPVPDWVHSALRAWLRVARIEGGRIFRAINKSDRVAAGLSPAAVLGIVRTHAAAAGLALSPHDLRKTCAKLCRGAGGELEQIQFLLGHSSIKTTEIYLGGRQEIRSAVNDRLRLS
jgi:integrase